MAIDGYSLQTIPNFVGLELGTSDWVTVDQERIDGFATCTGDHQWIHVDPERCRRESPFGAPIAHGFLTLSLLGKLMNDIGVMPEDARQAVNAGVDNVRFSHPVLAGQRVRSRATLNSADPKGEDRLLIKTGNVLEIEDIETPALTADITIMLYR